MYAAQSSRDTVDAPRGTWPAVPAATRVLSAGKGRASTPTDPVPWASWIHGRPPGSRPAGPPRRRSEAESRPWTTCPIHIHRITFRLVRNSFGDRGPDGRMRDWEVSTRESPRIGIHPVLLPTLAAARVVGYYIGVWGGVCAPSWKAPGGRKSLISKGSDSLLGRSRKPVNRSPVPWVRIPPPPLPIPWKTGHHAGSRVPHAAFSVSTLRPGPAAAGVQLLRTAEARRG
jgi:hypothetical protein